MDLNAKDSFYPQFENCNSSSLGMENSVRKDNQEVYVDAERGVPAQFGHGEFASFAQSIKMCMHANLNVLNMREMGNSFRAVVYIEASYQGIPVPKYA